MNTGDILDFGAVQIALIGPPRSGDAGTIYTGTLVAAATWDQLLDLRGSATTIGLISTVSVRRVGLVGSTYATPTDQPVGALVTVVAVAV